MGFYYLYLISKDYQKNENEDKKDEELKNHKEERKINKKKRQFMLNVKRRNKARNTENQRDYESKQLSQDKKPQVKDKKDK